jgi:predicted HTH transcriptional regulator
MARSRQLNPKTALRQKAARYENFLQRGLVSMAELPADVKTHLQSKKTQEKTFWFELLAELDFYDAKILDVVYRTEQGATTLQQLVRRLRTVGIKREAIRRRLRMLANLGLLDLAEKTKPLCVSSRIELESKVITLIEGVYRRLGVRQQ